MAAKGQVISESIFSMKGMQAYTQLLADAGSTKSVMPAERVVTERFIEFANDFDRGAFERTVR